MQVPMKIEEKKTEETMEERLARVGAKIDHLIVKAGEARGHVEEKLEALKAKEEATLKKGEEVLDELKLAMDCAWYDVNEAWKDIKEGTERAAQKLHSKKAADH